MTLVCGSCKGKWDVPEKGRKLWWCPYCGMFVEIVRPLQEGE